MVEKMLINWKWISIFWLKMYYGANAPSCTYLWDAVFLDSFIVALIPLFVISSLTLLIVENARSLHAYVLKLLFVLKSWTLGVYLRPTTIYFALDFTPIPELYTFHAMEKYIIYLPYRMLKRKNVNLTNRKLDSSLSICINWLQSDIKYIIFWINNSSLDLYEYKCDLIFYT